MPAAYRRNAKPQTKKKVKVTKSIQPAKLSDPVKAGVLAVVRKMISRDAENKLIGNLVELDVNHNSAIGPADCEPVIMEVSPIDAAAGSTARQRIGDKIKPKSLKVKGILSFDSAYLAGSSDIYARVMILSQKDVKTGAQVLGGSVDTSALLRPGFGASADQVPFTGITSDLNYDVNRDKFRVYMDKVIKLVPRAEGGVESVGKYSARWSYTFKDLPATLTYDENNGDWCNNFAPFLCIGYAYSDGSPADTVTTRLVSNVYSQLQFEDM